MDAEQVFLACVLAAIEEGAIPLEDEQDMAALLAALAKVSPPPSSDSHNRASRCAHIPDPSV